MQLRAIIRKENLVLLKSWQSYLIALFVPIIMLLINLYISSSRGNVVIKVGYINDEFISNSELVNYISEYVEKYGIKYDFIKCESSDINNNSLDLTLDILNNNQIQIYANLNSNISKAGAQYIVYAIQQLNSRELVERYPNELEKIQSLQPYKLLELVNLGGKADNNIQASTITLFSILWILLYFPLNTSIAQILQEKQQRTMYYLCKSSVSKFKILFGKLIALLFQSFLTLGIFFIAVKLFKYPIFEISFVNFIYNLLILTCICSLGYLIGLLTNSAGVTTIISLILFLPVTLSTTLQSPLAINNVLKLLPTYYCASLINEIMSFQNANPYNVIIICLFSLLFFLLSGIIFIKTEPAKLCKSSE